MITADSSSFVGFLAGEKSPDTLKIQKALPEGNLILTPVVLTELLSWPGNVDPVRRLMSNLILIELMPGFWERAAENRRLLRAKGLKARLADTLIAQCCIDANVPLIARDTDFRHFETFCGLALA